MEKKIFFKIITFIVVSLFAFSAAAQMNETKVRSFLDTTGERLIGALGMEDIDERYAVLDEVFKNNVDTIYMGKYVLGQYYRLLSDAQKERYHPLFNRYIKSLYKSYPIDFKTDEIGFEILKVVVKDKFADATASIRLPEKYRTENMDRIKVEFVIHEKGGVFQVADLKIADVSMLIALKNRFMQMIKDDEEEMEWFLEDFEDLVKSNEANLEP